MSLFKKKTVIENDYKQKYTFILAYTRKNTGRRTPSIERAARKPKGGGQKEIRY